MRPNIKIKITIGDDAVKESVLREAVSHLDWKFLTKDPDTYYSEGGMFFLVCAPIFGREKAILEAKRVQKFLMNLGVWVRRTRVYEDVYDSWDDEFKGFGL